MTQRKPYSQRSHYHCWEGKQPPPCGQKGKHLRCCLCEAKPEEKNGCTPYCYIFGEYTTHVKDCPSNIARLGSGETVVPNKPSGHVTWVEAKKNLMVFLDKYPATRGDVLDSAYLAGLEDEAISHSEKDLIAYDEGKKDRDAELRFKIKKLTKHIHCAACDGAEDLHHTLACTMRSDILGLLTLDVGRCQHGVYGDACASCFWKP